MDNKLISIDKKMTEEKAKKLKHVQVYDDLYKKIKEGVFQVGSKLPSEPELAVMMGVSRMTLRRALALLQDDNLVELVRGKGNFVKGIDVIDNKPKLNIIQHPFYACTKSKCDSLESEFRIEIPSESIAKSIEQQTPAVVIVDRWYKEENSVVGYTLSILPIEVMSENNIDLNVLSQLESFLEKSIYDKISSSSSKFSFTVTGNFTANKYLISVDDSFILIQEKLYDKNGRIIIFNKHYIPVEDFKMQITLKK